MKISHKIWAGFISLLILMSVMVVYNYYQLKQVRENIDDLTEYRLLNLNAAHSFALNVARQGAAVRGYLATGDEKFIGDYNEAKKTADEQLAFLDKHAKNREVFDPLKQAAREYEPFPPTIIQLYKEQGQQTAASYMSNVAAPANAKVLTQTNKYLEYHKKSLDTAMQSLADAGERKEKLSLILLAIGILTGSLLAYLITKPITRALSQVGKVSSQYADGDFRETVDIKSSDELGRLATALNKMRESFQDVLEKLTKAAGQLNDSSRQLAAQAQQTSAGATETAATVTEVAASVQEVANNAKHVADLSGQAAREAELGAQGAEQVTGQMELIKATSDEASKVVDSLSNTLMKVNQIVDLITAIAEQTNLLALNAAIEAARAGEQGRGFAVVAEEVRKLAEQSGNAAKEINHLIGQVQVESKRAVLAMQNGNKQANDGAVVVREVGNKFSGILGSVEELARQVQSVAMAAEQISEGVQNVAATAEEQTAAIEEVTAATEQLSKMADDLNGLVHKFKF